MAERFDKNGIRILDPEKQVNRTQKPIKCFPDQHLWKEDGFVNKATLEVRFVCLRCGDITFM